MADRLYTSGEADEVLNALRFVTELEKVTLARIAFVLSLVREGPKVKPRPNFSGGELKRPTFVGEDEVFLRSLISYMYRKPDIGEDDFFSNRSIVKNHIDSGAATLENLFQECGRDADSLLKRLVEEVEFSGRRDAIGRELDVYIGRTLLKKEELTQRINNTVKHAR